MFYDYGTEIPFNSLLGKTIVNIEGAEQYSERIIFTCSDGTVYAMFHGQECCEEVYLEDVCGDINCLLNKPITVADVRTNSENRKPETDSYDHFTWTFFHLATIHGYVTIRWYGSSNGYYSETAGLYKDFVFEDEGE